MQILTIKKGYTNGYYNVGLYYLASTWGCRNTSCYNVGLYVLSTWGFDYTNFNVGLYSTGIEIHYVNGARLTPYELIVGTNVGPFSTMDGLLLRMVNCFNVGHLIYYERTSFVLLRMMNELL